MFLSSKQHYRTLCTFYIKNPFNYHVQVRSFKTKRTINAELERKSLFINTLKKWMAPFFGIDPFPKDKNYALMKKLMDNTQSTVDERRNFMFAFVHGYNVGLQTRPRPVYIAIKTFLIFIAVISLVYVFTTGSGIRLPLDAGRYRPQTTNVTFDDVKGIPEAKGEVLDIVEFLKNPEKFAALGAKLPKGVLLVGPPGTGKTLLARAIAGEAGVPFFQAAGPEFDEVLVGQGARRLRDLFRAARDRAPSVIFIDEIDSVASKRVNSSYHPYANQTINQLLTEMDGFLQNEGVIVLGATNRRDVLDAALTRPGRFDVEVTVQRPDYISRKEIFDLYLSKVLTKDVDSDRLARSTIGFTGADIENMVNQAALKAAINNSEYVTMKHLDYAKDKLIMGIERKVKITDAETNTITAYHEAGHALVGYYTSDARPIYKITILAHTRSLGHTEFLQNKDEYFDTKAKLLAEMDAAMGGRAAEELVFGSEKVTSGAQSDFEKATVIAESMVNLYGMSEKAGLVIRRQTQSEGYLPGPTSDDLASSEVKRLIQESYERAKMILQKHSKELHAVAEALLKYETLTKEDMIAVINGENIPKPANSPTNVV